MSIRSMLVRGVLAAMTVLGMAGGSLAVAESPAGATTNGTISGTVTLSGKPAATASGVCIAIFTAGGFESSVAGTGATGTFSVQGFSPTTSYVVLAHTAPVKVRTTSITCSKSPYFAARFSGDTSTLTSATSVKGQSTGLHITLPAAGAISGTAKNTTGVPLQGVCVTANTTSFHSFVSTATPSTGDYSFEGLTPGAYTVRFTTATCPSAPTGTGYVGKTVSLTVVASTTQTYTATLTLAGGLEGKVTNSSRVGIATVCVYASEVTGTSFFGGPTATTNATGNFTLKGLIATKQYVVEYSTIQCNSTSQNYVPQFAKDKATITQATKIQLQAGTFTNGVTATLVAGGAISGTVKNTAGAALATVCVSANPISSGAPAANAQTSSTGTYTLEGLATGTYMVEYSGCGAIQTADYVPQYWNDKPSTVSATPVAVTAENTSAGKNATMVQGGRLTGHADNATTKAAATSVCVDVYSTTTTSNAAASTVTEKTFSSGVGGTWSVTVPPGTYEVEYSSGCGPQGYVRQTSGSLTVTKGKTTTAPTVTMVPGTAPAFTAGTPPTTAKVGTPYSYTFVATGTPAPTYSFAQSEPSWLAITALGTVSGKPTSTGTFSIQVEAQNGVTPPAFSTFTRVTVAAGTAAPTTPAVKSGSTTISTRYAKSTVVFSSTGTPTPTLTETGALPKYTTFTGNTAGTATITYTPPGTTKLATPGSYPIKIIAHNAHGTSTFTTAIVVETPGRITTGTARCVATKPCTHQFSASGYPAPTYVVTTASKMPAGLSLSSSGLLSGTATTTGTYFVTVTLVNPVQHAPSELVITVGTVPVFTSAATATFVVGKPGSYTFTATGFPTPRFFITPPRTTPIGVSLSGTHLTTLSAMTSGKYLQAGTYHFKVSATNTAGTATQTFTLHVLSPPSAPVKSAGSLTFVVGSSGSVTFQSTGTPKPTYSVIGALPTGLTLTATTGVLSGTPATTTSGVYRIKVVATSGASGSASATFTLKVSGPPHGVTPAGTDVTFTSGLTKSVTFHALGYPVPTLSLYTTTLPVGLSYTVGTNGTLVVKGDPLRTTSGPRKIHVQAKNTDGIAAGSDTLVVTAPTTITSAPSTTFTVGQPGTFQVKTSGFPAPRFTTKVTGLPSGVSLSVTGKLHGTPAATTGGAYTVTIKATNGVGTAATQTFTLTVDQAPAFTSTASTTFTVGKSGTFQVKASGYPAPKFSLASGTLPNTVTLGSTGKLHGTPAAATHGVYMVKLKATNGIGTPATQTFTLTVNQAPVFTSATSATFTVGQLGTFRVTAAGTPAPKFSVTSGTLPKTVTLTPSTGKLSGTPAAGTGGAYGLTIKATNSAGSTIQSFLLIVDQAPAFTSTASTTFTVGKSGTFQVKASGYPAPKFSLASGTLPHTVTLGSTGKLSGTPAATTGGVYTFTIKATNGVGTAPTQTFTLTVHQAPVFTSTASTTFTVGHSGTFQVKASGYPAPKFSVTSGTLPKTVTLTPTTGKLSGTPAATTGGVYTVTIKATNGVGTAPTQTFTLTVHQAPVFTSTASTTFTVGHSGTFQVKASGYPAPKFSLASGTLPNTVTLGSTGKLSGTPAATTGGAYTVTIKATNGVGTAATQGFTLTVDRAPAFTSAPSTTFTVGHSGTFQVKASGYPAPKFSVTTGTLPKTVTLTPTTGKLSGTPAATTGGAYTVTIKATNGVGTAATQTFTLTVDQAPAITSVTSVTFTVGKSGTFQVKASGYPAPKFSLASGTLPNTVTLGSTGKLHGTPAAGTQGVYTVQLKATNGVGTAATQRFTLTVDEAPIITSAASATFTEGKPGTFHVTATGTPAPTFSVTSGTLPKTVTLSSTGTLSGTPAATTGGVYHVNVEASNAAGTFSQTFTLTVDQAPVFTSVGAATFTAGQDGSFHVTANGYPSATFSETGPLPAGVSLAATGLLSGATAVTVSGTYPVTITATNSLGRATQTFVLTVRPAGLGGKGYWEVASDGGLFAFGSAKFYGSMGGKPLNAPIVGLAGMPTAKGYWEVASDGGLFAFGSAKFYGSMGGKPLNAPIVGMTATATGGGYWEVASDGGLFSFGNAKFYGSMGGKPLNAPIVGMAATPTGGGYWEVASDGGLFSFGNAQFYGSMGGKPLNEPIVGMAATPTGGGYWEVASDGGLFSFGNAQFYGSMGGKSLNKPIVGMEATPTGGGYWEVASDGGLFSFGNAQFYGSMGGKPLNAPIVGLSEFTVAKSQDRVSS